MATNPMQKKSRISFMLGMLLMLIIAALVVAFLYMKIRSQQEEIQKYKTSTTSVYILNQDVKSGQVLEPSMFTLKQVSRTTIPANATTDIVSTLSSYSLATKDGMAIYYNPGVAGNTENPTYYFIQIGEERKPIYITDSQGKTVLASNLSTSDKAFYFAGANNTQKTEIEISEEAVAAKVDMNANTVITGSLITRTNEVVSNDLRKVEYNVINLPVDLAPNEYIDVRLTLPNGQNYIVVSKKRVSIPAVDAQYLSDTIQMNLTEEEILTLSCAIYENYKMKGSKLEAVRYTDAGLQTAATKTYQPNDFVYTLIHNDPNVVNTAIKNIKERAMKDIDNALKNYEAEDDILNKNSIIPDKLEIQNFYLNEMTMISVLTGMKFNKNIYVYYRQFYNVVM